MIRPHPPRFLMKRRKTVSVTPAMGASTVAGAMRTFPIFKTVGNPCASVGTGVSPVRPTAASVLSQNFCTVRFYVLFLTKVMAKKILANTKIKISARRLQKVKPPAEGGFQECALQRG